MPSKLSPLSSDPWLDMASAVQQPFEKDELIRELRPPLCGDGLRKLLSSSKLHTRSPARKRVTSGRGSSDKDSLLVGGPQGSKNRGLRLAPTRNADSIVEGRIARSPSNDSLSFESTGMPKRNRRIFSELLTPTVAGRDGEGQEVAPYYVLQFDPSDSSDSPSPRKTTDEEKQMPIVVDVENNDEEENRQFDDMSTTNPTLQTSFSVQRIPPPIRPSRKKGKSAPWSTSLPSVAEEILEEGSTQSASSPSVSSPSSHSDLMKAMRSLVRKQQKSIEDMENENRRFREELAEYRQMLSEAHVDRTKQEDKIGLLTAEKQTTESATLWLREEMKALKAEIARMKEEVQSNKPYFPRANQNIALYKSNPRLNSRSEEDPDLVHFAKVKKAIYGSILEVDSLLKSRSEESFAESTSFTDDRRDDETAASSSLSFNECERRDDDDDDHHRRTLNNRHAGTSSESSGTISDDPANASSRTDEGRGGGVEISHSNAARSKEEVNLFKSRLEAIQKKREERKIREGDFGSRSGRVRFD
ncbi:hypothetical protein ACA910_010651 [Epithemia clementina (nom. ined.)]